MTDEPTTDQSPDQSPDEPPGKPRDRTTWLLVGLALVLVLAAIGLWLWLGNDGPDDGPDYAADCAMVEQKAPEFGNDLAAMFALQQTGASPESQMKQMPNVTGKFRTLADDLTDRAFAHDIEDAMDASDNAMEALSSRDMAAATTSMKKMIPFIKKEASWLDKHCARWIGPGQWGKPGSKPTGLPSLPAVMPSDMPSMPSMPALPSNLPSGLPSDMPSMPDMPDLPQ